MKEMDKLREGDNKQSNFSRPSSTKPKQDRNFEIIYYNSESGEENGISVVDADNLAVGYQGKHFWQIFFYLTYLRSFRKVKII